MNNVGYSSIESIINCLKVKVVSLLNKVRSRTYAWTVKCSDNIGRKKRILFFLSPYLVGHSRTDHRRHSRDRSQNAMSRLSHVAESSNAPFPRTMHHFSVILSSRGRLHHWHFRTRGYQVRLKAEDICLIRCVSRISVEIFILLIALWRSIFKSTRLSFDLKFVAKYRQLSISVVDF